MPECVRKLTFSNFSFFGFFVCFAHTYMCSGVISFSDSMMFAECGLGTLVGAPGVGRVSKVKPNLDMVDLDSQQGRGHDYLCWHHTLISLPRWSVPWFSPQWVPHSPMCCCMYHPKDLCSLHLSSDPTTVTHSRQSELWASGATQSAFPETWLHTAPYCAEFPQSQHTGSHSYGVQKICSAPLACSVHG